MSGFPGFDGSVPGPGNHTGINAVWELAPRNAQDDLRSIYERTDRVFFDQFQFEKYPIAYWQTLGLYLKPKHRKETKGLL
jgi:hypothetical protein